MNWNNFRLCSSAEIVKSIWGNAYPVRRGPSLQHHPASRHLTASWIRSLPRNSTNRWACTNNDSFSIKIQNNGFLSSCNFMQRLPVFFGISITHSRFATWIYYRDTCSLWADLWGILLFCIKVFEGNKYRDVTRFAGDFL